MEEMQKKLKEAEQRVQLLEEEKDKKREKKKKKLSAKEEFKEEEIPEDLWEQREYYQVRAKSQVLLYKQREAAFKEARLLAGLAEINKGLQGLAIVRTSSATASKGSKDGSEQAEQRKLIPKEIPKIAVDPLRALSHYLLWANEVENVLLRTRPAEMWARAVAANLTGPAAAVAQRAISENVSGGKAVKCSLLTGIYGVGSWEGVVEQEWDDTRLGHREDLRALKERLDQLAVVLGKSQVEVKKTFGKRVLEEMRTRLKAGIPGNKIMRGDFEWERALEIVQEVFIDSLRQGKQHQDFRGFGQGRGGHRYERGQGFHRGGPPRFHQQAPRSAACHRCGKDNHWARNCILNLQHRDFRHMWRCNICGNKGHGPVRCPFCDGCQQQQNQQQQNLTQQQHQEQPKETNKQNNSNYIVADLNLFWEKGAAEREDWRGKNTENKMGEEAVLGETVLETTGEEARDETERNKEPRAEIRSEEPEEATDNAQEEPDDKRGEEKTKAQVAQHGNTNKKIAKKKNVKKRSYEVEAERWEEMKREGKVDNCRLWLPLEVEGERTLALYDTGTTRSFCNKEFIHHHNLTRRSTKWSAATQAGTLVKILGEVDIKVKSVRGQVEYTVLVVAGGRGILVLLEKDGRKLGIHVVGLLAGFLDEQAAIMDDREWVEENTADMRKEVQASANELEEINKIVGPALDKNKKLPKSAVCN